MLENWKGPHIIQGIKPFSPEKKKKKPLRQDLGMHRLQLMKQNSRRDLILACGSWRREEQLQQRMTSESCWEVLDAIAGSYIQTWNKIQSLKADTWNSFPGETGGLTHAESP